MQYNIKDHKQNDLCGFSCLTEAITLTLSNKLVVFTIIFAVLLPILHFWLSAPCGHSRYEFEVWLCPL